MDADPPFAPMDPAYRTLLFWQAGLPCALLLVAGVAVEFAAIAPPGAALVPAALLALIAGWRVPRRRYAAAGLRVAPEGRLDVARGTLVRTETSVPFGRVQHIDLSQGPFERALGLATLHLHTAGVHNASVAVPGLAESEAIAIRDSIRAAIRQPAG